MLLLKLEQAAQAAQAPSLFGKSFTVGKVSTAGGGLSKWLVLHPVGATGAAAAKGTAMLKVEGGRQLSGLVGKSVFITKSPVLGASGAKYLALHPAGMGAAKAAAGVAGFGAAGKGAAAAGKGSIAMKVNGATAGHFNGENAGAIIHH